MPFEIIRADITTLGVDSIVNAAKSTLLGGGGVDGAIHKAAGPGLLEECKRLGGCAIGQAKITKGYNLTAEFVIHTVGPVWNGGNNNEEQLLISCYRNALLLAVEKGLQSVAFPLISSGIYGYPKDQALRVAVSVITEFLMEHDLMVYLAVYDKKAFAFSEKLFVSVKAYIDDHFVDEHADHGRRRSAEENNPVMESACFYEEADFNNAPMQSRSLEDVLAELENTFSEHLLRLIDQKGKTDVETYKRANVDRKLFSKIRKDCHYKPSKTTAIAFAVALELNLDETRDLLLKAGYALSPSYKFDLIIEYFIREGSYNIHEINETLFAFDQPLLGA